MNLRRARMILCALLPASAFAQIGAIQTLRSSEEANGSIRFHAPPRFAPRPILALPYSGDESTERVILSPDGTQSKTDILDRKLYRDSAGRTLVVRTEAAGALMATTSEIDDSVAGFHYVLDLQRQVAHRFRLPQTIVSPVSDRNPPKTITGASLQTESLGTKAFGNVVAVGQRWTAEHSVREVWTVPDLKIDVLSKSTTADPNSKQAAEFITTLSRIDRAEPDPSLFRVPSNYRIVDENGPIAISFTAP